LALPTTRSEFTAYVLRRLGSPTIKINVTPEQIEDRVDDAISMWQDYHFRGTEKVYLAHQVTDQDKANKYVELDEKIKSITRMLSLGVASGVGDLFSLNYQFAQSDMLQNVLSTGSIVPLWMALTHIEFVQQILVGGQPIRFNMHTDRVYVDMDWNRVVTGQYIVFEGYKAVSPDDYPDIWSDRWLLEYTTELVKREWGSIIKKFGGMQMAGGMTFNGQIIYDEADAEVKRLENDLMTKLSGQAAFIVG
jgi:hypothetical protein